MSTTDDGETSSVNSTTTTTISTATTTNPTSTTTASTNASTSTTMSYPTTPTEAMETGTIVGIVCGVTFVFIIIFVVVLVLWRRRRKKQKSKPPMLPDPYPPASVSLETGIANTSSTIDLVRNDSLDPTQGTSADCLPMAPEPPDYEPSQVYVNQGPEDDTREDYVEPRKWAEQNIKPVSDDLYMPMGTTTKSHSGDIDKPVPSSQLVYELGDSDNNTRPSLCGPSFNKGYVNVPDSQPTVGTLPKYANLEGGKGKEKEDSEDEEQEDYENVPGAKSVKPFNVAQEKMKALSLEISQKNANRQNQSSSKPPLKPKSKSANTPKSTPRSTPSSTPKVKHKSIPSSNGEGAPDYVNVHQYAKKPHSKDHLDEVKFQKH